jgi:hypothetical protein
VRPSFADARGSVQVARIADVSSLLISSHILLTLKNLMPLLDAILAFAVTMLVVATVVSLLVDVCHKVFALRKEDFEVMLVEFNEKELTPVIDRELARLTATLTPEKITDIQNALARYNATPRAKALQEADLAAQAAPDNTTAIANAQVAAVAKAKVDLLQENPQAVRIHLTTDELIEKLKRTELGTTILTTLGDKAKTVFDELAKRYEVIGEKYTAIFRKKARWIATGVALVLAIALNIDTVNVLQAYMSDQTLREAVVAKYSKAVADHEAAAKAQGTNADKQSNLEELKASVAKAQMEITGLNSAGFPIGYSYFPWHRPNGVSLFLCLSWIVGIALTAFFAGLGSPFWFDVVRGVAHMTQGAKQDKAKS